MIPFINTNSGSIIRTALFIIIILLVLGYFGFNLRSIVNSPTFQDNWMFVRGVVVDTWNTYLNKPFDYLLNKIFIPLIWDPAISGLLRMKNDGSPVILQSQTPQMPVPSN
ncbi:MAG: hypothetical protein WCP09_02365 [Candidatus Taylorbacteria bacterium]